MSIILSLILIFNTHLFRKSYFKGDTDLFKQIMFNIVSM